MIYAKIAGGVVTNLIVMEPAQARGDDSLVAVGNLPSYLNDLPVKIGDSYADGHFYSDSKRVYTPQETLNERLDEIYVNVKKYGADGNGETDDTAAINAAIAATAEGQTLFFPAGTYNASEPIEIAKEINVIMDGTLRYVGSANIAVLSIGSGTITAGMRFVLSVTRQVVSDWTNENSVSIKLINVYQSDITIMDAGRSTIGVQFLGDASGFVYNTIRLYNLESNKYAVDVANVNSGWCNENLYLGGRFWVQSDLHNDLSRYGVRIHSLDTGDANDQNVFSKPCFELGYGGLTGGAEAVPILIEHGGLNYFEHCRIEDCSDTVIRDATQRNFVSVSYPGSASVHENTSETHCGTTVEIIPEHAGPMRNLVHKVFDSGPLFKRASYYGTDNWTDHDKVLIPGMMHMDTSAATLSQCFWATIYHRYVNFNYSYIGVFLKTDKAKNFMIAREFRDAADADRLIVQCYDADMNIIDGSGTLYIKWLQNGASFYWYTDNAAYGLSDDFANDVFFQIADNVKYIFVAAKGPLRSFTIHADNPASAFSPYDAEGDPHAAIAAPIIGTHMAGKRLTNDAPSSGNPKGWICTGSGTLDTISTTCTADDSAVVVVADATGLDIGQFISIDSGAALQILKIDGTSITMSDTVGAGSGLTFVNSPATWESEGNL